jgi:PAS domain S-box-containing protein
MGWPYRIAAFLRSRPGAGFIKFALFCAVLSAAVGYGFYLSGLTSFEANKRDEKITALQLVDAFVTNYAALRAELGSARAPVPATFRAHSIELFNKARDAENVLRLRWVGRAGRQIATPPADDDMAAAIESFVGQAAPKPHSSMKRLGDDTVFRTVYPSVASQQSCVDCHNLNQPTQHWQLNDVMGAFSIDVPAGAFLHGLRLQCIGIGLGLFLALAAVGLKISRLHYRQLAERERTQVRVKQSEERFRDFAEISSDWFWEQDANLRFVSLSSAVARSGLAADAHLGKTRREVVHHGVTEQQWQEHQADLDARRPFQNFRFQRPGPGGDFRHISVSGKPFFDAAGDFGGYRGTAKDVTMEVQNELELARRVETRTAELRAAQEELLRNERLSTLGQLTATVAHELRNPLSAIRNTVFSIAEAIAAHGLRLDRPLGRLERSIGRCDRIIADLLDYARTRELKRASMPLERWLVEVLDEQSVPPGIALRHEFGAPGLHATIDPDRLRRVVINLVENAAQARAELPPEHKREIVLATRAGADHVEIEVRDTGPGIPPDVLPRVFDPLFSTKSFGTGLGLPTVKQIVEQHGGTIAIDSSPGGGTRVTVTLPLPHAEELAA